jgi:hypothetical protein
MCSSISMLNDGLRVMWGTSSRHSSSSGISSYKYIILQIHHHLASLDPDFVTLWIRIQGQKNEWKNVPVPTFWFFFSFWQQLKGKKKKYYVWLSIWFLKAWNRICLQKCGSETLLDLRIQWHCGSRLSQNAGSQSEYPDWSQSISTTLLKKIINLMMCIRRY